MANIVWHTALKMLIDLRLDDLGHPELPELWEQLYRQDRLYAARQVPVAARGLACGGVCRDAGVVAWMHLREREGRREAVHDRAEDEARHHAPVSDEHKAYQERIVRTALTAGFQADSEVRTLIGRSSFIQTDTLVEGGDGRKIGWEVQLSTAGQNGPKSVRARAKKAAAHGVVPAWHTDRPDYAKRNDTQWTMSNRLPAHIIAKTGDLRVVSGFRALEFYRCDLSADYPCLHGVRRCGKVHAMPKPRDVMFDALVLGTAAGSIVPLEHPTSARVYRFWVTASDYDRYRHSIDTTSTDSTQLPVRPRPNNNPPTCHPAPQITVTTASFDWSDPSHGLDEPRPCLYCRKPAHLVDDHGRPSHKVCAEAHAATRT